MMFEAIGSFFGGLWALAVACLLAGAGWHAFDVNNKKALTLIRIGFVFTAIFSIVVSFCAMLV